MKNHGGYGRHGDYSFETERDMLPNPLDIAANIANGLYTAYRVITYPVRKGLETIATKTTKAAIRTTIHDSNEDFD